MVEISFPANTSLAKFIIGIAPPTVASYLNSTLFLFAQLHKYPKPKKLIYGFKLKN